MMLNCTKGLKVSQENIPYTMTAAPKAMTRQHKTSYLHLAE